MSEILTTIGIYTVVSEPEKDCIDQRNPLAFLVLLFIGGLFIVPRIIYKDLGNLGTITLIIAALVFVSSIFIPDLIFPRGCGVRIYTQKSGQRLLPRDNDDQYKFTSDVEEDKANINKILESHVEQIHILIEYDTKQEENLTKCETKYQERVSNVRINK